jgi:hypothetical protein
LKNSSNRNQAVVDVLHKRSQGGALIYACERLCAGIKTPVIRVTSQGTFVEQAANNETLTPYNGKSLSHVFHDGFQLAYLQRPITIAEGQS